MTDWIALFSFDTPPLEIFIRGTCVFWALFLMIRFFLNRGAGSIGISDLLMVVLLGDAAQNAMAGDYKSIPDGILLVAVIIGWNYIMDWAAYHFTCMRWFLIPKKVCMIRNGKMQRKNMARQFITEEELFTQLRLNDATALNEIKEAYLESNGEISVVKFEDSR